jgi:hypothetical protein
MGTTLNRKAYQKLIDEDIVWLLKQPQCLESDHILIVLLHSANAIYGKGKDSESSDSRRQK